MMRLQETINSYREYQKSVHAVLSTEIMEEVREILENDDAIYTAYGYTPYFNDGDQCYYSFWMDEDIDPDEFPNIDSLVQLFDSIPDKLLCDIYGDHKKFSISRNGMAVEDYEHD